MRRTLRARRGDRRCSSLGALAPIGRHQLNYENEAVCNSLGPSAGRKCCRRVDLASTLVTLVTSLAVAVASGVHILLPLHRS